MCHAPRFSNTTANGEIFAMGTTLAKQRNIFSPLAVVFEKRGA
jgi:hypothetical protein